MPTPDEVEDMICTADVIEAIARMTLDERRELLVRLEQRWGIEAAPIPMLGISFQPGDAGYDPHAKIDWTVTVVALPADKRVGVIRALRSVFPDRTLAQTTFHLARLPYVVQEGMAKGAAEDLVMALEWAGAVVTLT